MKTKRIFATVLVGVLALSTLAGCGQKKNQGEEQAGRTVISVDGWPDKNAVPTAYERMEGQRMAFMKEYPDIVLNGVQGGYDVQTFLAKAEGGMLPTMYEIFLTETKKIYELGYSGKITEQVKVNGFYGKLNEYLMDKITFDGDIYYMPQSLYTLGIVVNLDLYEAAGLVDAEGNLQVPETFEELAEISKIIHKKTGKAGFVMPTNSNVGGWNFMPIAWGYGTTFVEKENGKWVSKFNSPECVAALELLKKMKWEDNSLPDSTLINANEAIQLVGTGQAAMTMAHPGQIEGLQAYGIEKDSIGMIKMPAGPARRVTLLGGNVVAFNCDATEEQKNACMEWLKFRGITDEMDENTKKSIEDSYITLQEKGALIGIRDLSMWADSSEREQYVEQMHEKYTNINPNHVKSYNDKDGVEYQAEEPVCTQDLYRLLDGCIQEALTNKDADCAALIAEASDIFQENFLDYEE